MIFSSPQKRRAEAEAMLLLDWIDTTIAQTTFVAQGLMAAWLLTMISMPILTWLWGEQAEVSAVKVSVSLQAATVLAILWPALGGIETLKVAVAIPVLGWVAETIGHRTGFPFGKYAYTDRLQPQLCGVPVIIPLAWLMMMPPAWATAAAVSRPGSRLAFAVMSAAAFTAWDLFLDPQMVSWNLWVWASRGARSGKRKMPHYFGIPWTNYAGWFAVSLAITLALGPQAQLAQLPVSPLLLIYGLTWALEAFGLLAFWRMPGPALVGTLGMGGCLLWAALRVGGG